MSVPGPPRPPLGSRRETRIAIGLLLAVVVATVVVIIVVVSGGPGAQARDGLGPITLTKQEQRGRGLFGLHCANCHTLAAAGATATVGPSLDMLRPPAPAVLSAIRRGPGGMPADVVTGRDAQAVAQFVAAVTAH